MSMKSSIPSAVSTGRHIAKSHPMPALHCADLPPPALRAV